MAGQDKTEKPTPQRLREARLRGDIPTSSELVGGLMTIAGLVVLGQQGGHLVNGLQSLLSRDLALAGGARRLSASSMAGQVGSNVSAGLELLWPLAGAMAAAGLGIGILNTRGLLSLKPLAPSLRKLNPASGLKHLFSKESIVLFVKTILKLSAAAVVVLTWRPAWQSLAPGLPLVSAGVAAGQAWQDSMQVALQIAAGFLIIGGVDAGYRYFSWSRRLRMTKAEVKEESKRSEGNPHIRSRMRQLARRRLRQIISGGGLRRVPQADVVITNPTHYAIAVQYKAGAMRAPKVIAKGQRLVALRIKEAARLHNVPIVENKPLAQTLFKAVDVNQEIPADLYHAVAHVLAFVYRMRGQAPRYSQAAAR